MEGDNGNLEKHFSECKKCKPAGSGGVCNDYIEIESYNQSNQNQINRNLEVIKELKK